MLGLLLGLAGCQRDPGAAPVVKVHEVTGQVLLAGSKPLSKGKVTFVRIDPPYLISTAAVSSDGRFSLTTGDSGEGAPEGQYKVRVEPDGPPPVLRGGRQDSKILPYPAKFLDEDSSGLIVTVKAEPNHLKPFVLK
jgi:hypothetical protein